MEHQLLVGKYTLESLTSGLYISPLDLYREYVQNAADSIDQAISKKILKEDAAYISIEVDSAQRSICIRDNGTGVSWEDSLTTLIDIGNSKKRHSTSRGFRGIGRLSGLGYCEKLRFKTTAIDEDVVTIIDYNTKLLQKLLSPQEENRDSVDDVLQKVISVSREPEKEQAHYFIVEMQGVPSETWLLDKDTVFNYMQQNLPVPFSDEFVWGTLIKQKLSNNDIRLYEYNIGLKIDGESLRLFKPYTNTVLSDRIRRIPDLISDIQFRDFFIGGHLSATIWYAQTNFYGTVLDKTIKGIRIRQGNILVGDQSSLRRCFKEERFNGWLVGELHIFDERIIPNTRRDDYEKTNEYRELLRQLSEWSAEISKMIRHRSYQRSLTQAEKIIVDENIIINPKETIHNNDVLMTELDTYDMDDSDFVANTDLLSKLSILMNMGNKVTKYNIINLNTKMTVDQKKTIEKVFDILYSKYSRNKANEIARSIVNEF